MKDPALSGQIEALARRINASQALVFFTGAGMSTESGIPDYRSQGGLWDKFKPVYFDDFMSSRDARIRYWAQRMDMEKSLKQARPNKGHEAIARLDRMGRVRAVITQNIDGLHHESGIPGDRIIELHGNTRRVRCMSCRQITDWHDAEAQILDGNPAPECSCGGYLKPDTISFGQAMPQDAVRRAARFASESDLFITVGSTLLVQPAAAMPDYARSAGAFTVIINLSPTPFDQRCSMRITHKAGAVLKQAVDLVQA